MRALVSLGVLITLIPSASAGFYFPPPGDRSPSWSPDGRRIAFLTGRLGGGLAVVNGDGSGEARLLADAVALNALSPDWTKVAFVQSPAGASELRVGALGGTQTRKVAEGIEGGFAWAPDSKRLAFGRANALFVVDDEGRDARQVAPARAWAPAWSPDGTRIAFQRVDVGQQPDLYVVNADGSDAINLTDDPGTNVEPRWSPDGHSLAFITTDGRRTQVEVIDAAGTNRRVLPVSGAATNSEVAWTPDGTQLWVGIDGGLVTVDLSTAETRRLFRFSILASGLDWSPDGTRVTFAAGGECRDREGIYVAEANGTAVRRITNDCRILGTEGADELRGTDLADVLVGLGGNDRLFAVDPGYVGDTLEGGPGADTLTGDYRADTLEGGSGSDVLRGGPSGDHLDGGAGRDRVDGEGGRDVIFARDGERDVVVCGTNVPGTPELDTATVDRFDVVASDCEVVHGKRARSSGIGTAGGTSLTIHFWPQGRRGASRSQRWTLACQPARGTLPRRVRACRLLLAMRRPFRPVPPGTACTEIYGGPQVAEVRGRFRGRRVSAQFTRTDGCQIERWNRVGFLFRS